MGPGGRDTASSHLSAHALDATVTTPSRSEVAVGIYQALLDVRILVVWCVQHVCPEAPGLRRGTGCGAPTRLRQCRAPINPLTSLRAWLCSARVPVAYCKVAHK